MGQRITWRRVSATRISPDTAGRVVAAYEHVSGARLLHRSPVSRHSRLYGRVGTWIVELDGRQVGVKTYYNQQLRAMPARWANACLRLHCRSNSRNGAATARPS